jgi:predicted RNase H-like nuclease
MTSVTRLYGVDAAKDGWVVARATPGLADVRLYLVPELEPLFWRVMRDDGLLAIDIPIGLPSDGPRLCDREARRLLGRPRGSSVFPAPMRSALAAQTYEEACRLNQDASGRRVSRQTYTLLPRIREVDSLIWVERQSRIFEAHPEISFMLMSGDGHGLRTRKKQPDGRRDRMTLLADALPDVVLEQVIGQVGSRVAPVDDCLDALACLVTASRIHRGSSLRLPSGRIEFDARSLRMEIRG